jgi:hypothetical protein
MKLDYISNINEYGDDVVRLYDFDMAQAILFRDAIQEIVLNKKQALELSSLPYIESRNCMLTLRITEEDLGIEIQRSAQLYCDLTLEAYITMVKLLEPFCNRETKGYKCLYDVDSPTDLLFSPGGTW